MWERLQIYSYQTVAIMKSVRTQSNYKTSRLVGRCYIRQTRGIPHTGWDGMGRARDRDLK